MHQQLVNRSHVQMSPHANVQQQDFVTDVCFWIADKNHYKIPMPHPTVGVL